MQGGEDQAFQEFLTDLQSGKLSFAEAKRRYVALGKVINERYALEITALSLDVVHSREVKASGTALQAQATFDAFHRWVLEKLNLYGCRSYTWAGDGLMAMFQKPEPAVAAARALIDDLSDFNRDHKLVNRDVQLRIGIHTGPVLPHEEVMTGESHALGKVASDTFDYAGHLQKNAAPNRLVISEVTHERLAEGAGNFAPLSPAAPGGGTAYVYPPLPAAASVSGHGLPQWSTTTFHDPPAPTYYGPPPSEGFPRWALYLSAVLLGALVFAVGVLLTNRGGGVVNSSTGDGGAPRPTPMQPVPGSNATPLVNAPGPAPNTPPSGAPANNAPSPPPTPTIIRSPVAITGPGPDRRPWLSPDAVSGVPGRLSTSPRDLRWLVCIAVERYRDQALSADGAEASAKTVAQTLQSTYGIPPDHVTWLANEQATGENIKQVFAGLQHRAASGKDTVIVYLAGAGTVERDRPDLRHQGGSGYVFLPSDAVPDDVPNTGIYGADIAAWLGATRAQTVLVMADTPNAGALAADLPQQPDPGRQMVLFAATGEGQKMAAGKSGQPDAFSDVLSTALRGGADLNRDRRVSLDELSQYLRSEVPRRTGGAQTPDVRTGFRGFMPELYLAGGA